MHFKNQCKEITLPNDALQQNMSSVDPKGVCPDPPVWWYQHISACNWNNIICVSMVNHGKCNAIEHFVFYVSTSNNNVIYGCIESDNAIKYKIFPADGTMCL